MKRFFAGLVRAYLSVKALRETRRELYALSDHLLRDIGLRREQISSGFLKRVVLAETGFAQIRAGRLVSEADRRREVAAP
jgi:uncharacterized protein YjiS (DUF1127 family)